MTLALSDANLPLRRYKFGPSQAGLPAAVSGPAALRFAAPNWIFNCQRTLVPAAWAAAAIPKRIL
jgi:hypothetical protein